MKKLYFIRHGQSEFNARGLYAGSTETPLTEEGREQAKQTGQDAKARDLKIDLIVASPLSRALDTAQIFAREIGYPEDKIVIDERVIERDYGELEAQQWSRAHTNEYREQRGAESVENLVARARDALNWIESRSEDSVVIVAHGAIGRALRSLVKEDYPMSHPHRLGNAELHEWL